jgi:hypothetical protein
VNLPNPAGACLQNVSVNAMDKIIIKGHGKELNLSYLIIISMFFAIFPIFVLQHRGLDTTAIVTTIICPSIIVFLFLTYKKDSWQLEIDKTSITYVTSTIFHKQKPKWTFSAKRPYKIILKKDKVRVTKMDYVDGASITMVDNAGKVTTKSTATPLTPKIIEDIAKWTKTNDLNLFIEA